MEGESGKHPCIQLHVLQTRITSIAIIEGAGAHIQYKAGVGVTLNPGFRIDGSNGSKFVAYIGPCPGGGIPPAYNYAPTMNGLSGYLLENK